MSDPVVLLSTGDVVGPAGGVTNNSMVLFNGTSGKLIKGNNAQVTAAGLALLDDVNADAQRVTLGLGTAATATLTTSATDQTAGRVLKVGDFGLGTTSGEISNIDSLSIPTGFYSYGDLTTGLKPSAHGTITITAGGNGAWVTQLAHSTDNVILARNNINNTSWTPWLGIARLDSPAFIGTPTAPTATPGTNTTQLANTAFVKAAVAAAPMLGVGQTWQDVTASRNLGVTYTNTTGKAITVIQVSAYLEAADLLSVYIDGLLILSVDQGLGPYWYGPVTFIVPSGATYSITKPVSPNIRSWLELRS